MRSIVVTGVDETEGVDGCLRGACDIAPANVINIDNASAEMPSMFVFLYIQKIRLYFLNYWRPLAKGGTNILGGTDLFSDNLRPPQTPADPRRPPQTPADHPRGEKKI